MAKREIRAPVGGSVWTHSASIGQRVLAGTQIMLCECMKTEFPIETPIDGVIVFLRPCGENIDPDDLLAVLEVDD